MNAARKKLLVGIVKARVRRSLDNGVDNGVDTEFTAYVINFGDILVDTYDNKEMISDAVALGIKDIPTLEELNAPET